MRLVEFTKSFHLGGTEGQVAELVRGLSRHHTVHVGVLDAKGPHLAALRAMDLCPQEFPLRGSVAHPNTAFQIARAAAWLRGVRAELVHVHDFYATLIAVPAALLAGCKVVVGRLDLAHWHGRVRRGVLSQLTRLADGVIANAEAIRTQLEEEEGVDPRRIAVLHNGIDLSRFDARAAQPLSGPLPAISAGAPVVIHVANMNHPVKRQEDLLETMALLKGRGLHALLVGDGPRRAQLEARAMALGLSGQVHFLGHRTDIPALYARATLGVLCSSAEGLSNAVIEGMAARLPMVVTSVGGNPELISDGVRGLVVPPGQPAALARAFARVLEHPADAKRMGQEARAFVERRLGFEQLVSQHEGFYGRVLASTPTTSATLRKPSRASSAESPAAMRATMAGPS